MPLPDSSKGGNGSVTGELDDSSQTVANELPGSSETDVFGVPPKGATRWRIKKKRGDDWVQCETALGEAQITEWPLADLSLKGIRARWGAGTYRVTWIDPTLKKKACGTGRSFALRPPPPPPAPAPAPAASAPAAGLPLASLLGHAGTASPQAMTGLMALMGGESAGLAQGLMLFQVFNQISSAQAEQVIARERAQLTATQERDRMFFASLMQMQQRGAAAAASAGAGISRKTEEMMQTLSERLDDLDDAIESNGGGGEGGGLLALLGQLPALIPLLQNLPKPG